MTRIEWNQPGERTYELGVSRGVLYPSEGPGVPWNGLISVEEQAVGGGREEFHFDGVKYFDLVTVKHFRASVRAFSTPRELGPSLGIREVVPGFLLTRQPKERFDFSYRTEVDTTGYKLHLVYNATISSGGKSYQTLSDSPSPVEFDFTVDAVPPPSTWYKPSAHFIIDTRKTRSHILDAILELLYGTDSSDPYLPDINDLHYILGNLITEPLTEPL